MLFAESSCVCRPSFRPVTPFFFLAKVPFFGFLGNTERVVAIQTCLRHSPGNTDYKYMWVCGSNFNRSSVNRGWMDGQINRLFTLYSIGCVAMFSTM